MLRAFSLLLLLSGCEAGLLVAVDAQEKADKQAKETAELRHRSEEIVKQAELLRAETERLRVRLEELERQLDGGTK